MKEIDPFTIERAKRGDKKAFDALYKHYAEYLWVQVYRTVNGNVDESQELLQRILIRVYKKLSHFSGKSAFSTWLYRLAYNEMMEYLRKRKRHRERFVPLKDELYVKDESTTEKDIIKVLMLLEPHERYLITARVVEGLSFDELSEITGKSSASLRTAVSRIKSHLREEHGYE